MIEKKPLRFTAVLQSMLWGGEAIIPFKRLTSEQKQVGESWEISAIKGSESLVAEGTYQGTPLSELVTTHKGALMGEENYRQFGDTFPLLVKFIDAKQDLSIQVHPDDAMAHQKHGKPFGKSEMWFVLPSEKEASMRVGLSEEITPEEYAQKVAEGTIAESLHKYPVKDGDCFYLPAGRIHSIGAGCRVAEIQQASDLTYRIFDFNRKDKEGNLRELHTELAAQAIDYTVLDDYKTHYNPLKNEGVELVNSPYFSTAFYSLTEGMELDYSELDSFVILIFTKGSALVVDEDNQATEWKAGDTLLLPAAANKITLLPEEGGVEFLETYV